MAVAWLTYCCIPISHCVVTPPARGVCCSNHPQLCALRAGFEALPPLGSSHCFFFHVLMQFAVLSPLTSLGHTSLSGCTPPAAQLSGKNTQRFSCPPASPVHFGLTCSSQMNSVLFSLAFRKKQFAAGKCCILWLPPAATPP